MKNKYQETLSKVHLELEQFYSDNDLTFQLNLMPLRELVELHTPKQVKFDSPVQLYCPNCNKLQSYYTDAKFCLYCGQALKH